MPTTSFIHPPTHPPTHPSTGLRDFYEMNEAEEEKPKKLSVPPLLLALCNEVEIIYQEVRLGIAEPTDKEAKLKKTVQGTAIK